MNVPPKPLVDQPAENEFRQRASLESFRKVWMGDIAKLPTEVHGYVKRANEALLGGLDKVARLADDPTKTEVVRHEAAKIVADRTVASIEESRAGLAAFGRQMTDEANTAIGERFTLRPERAQVYERIIGFVDKKSKEAGGALKIREAMKQDPEVVTVLSQFPPYVFELADDICHSIVIDGYKHHMPDAMNKMAEGQAIVEVAAGYDKVVSGVRHSFYNPALAMQAGRRVDI